MPTMVWYMSTTPTVRIKRAGRFCTWHLVLHTHTWHTYHMPCTHPCPRPWPRPWRRPWALCAHGICHVYIRVRGRGLRVHMSYAMYTSDKCTSPWAPKALQTLRFQTFWRPWPLIRYVFRHYGAHGLSYATCLDIMVSMASHTRRF